jgi:hypothetical protein
MKTSADKANDSKSLPLANEKTQGNSEPQM